MYLLVQNLVYLLDYKRLKFALYKVRRQVNKMRLIKLFEKKLFKS